MIGRALVAIFVAIIALAALDYGSWWVFPCAVQPVVPSSADQQKKEQAAHKLCPYKGGVVIADLRIIGRGLAALSPEDWTAIATIVVAIATLGLAISTHAQAQSTREQAGLIRDQGKLTGDQLALAREEFLASHRPEMVVHFMRLIKPKDAINDPLTVRFAVINAGTSAANITGSGIVFDFYPAAELPYLPDLPPNGVVGPGRMSVGATDNDVRIISTKWRFGDLSRAAKTGELLLVAGWIVYEDGREHARTTYFCRRCSFDLVNRFVSVGDPEAEKTY